MKDKESVEKLKLPKSLNLCTLNYNISNQKSILCPFNSLFKIDEQRTVKNSKNLLFEL